MKPIIMKTTIRLALLFLAGTSLEVLSKPNVVILYADDMGFGYLAIQNP